MSQSDKCLQRHNFLELRPEVKVTVTRRQYSTQRTPRCIHTPNLGSLPQILLEICTEHNFSRIEARGQADSYLKKVRDTQGPQGVSTHWNWDSYLKYYRRYAPDRIKARMDRLTVQKLYAPKVDFGGIKHFLGIHVFWKKKNHLMHLHSVPQDWGTVLKNTQITITFNYIRLGNVFEEERHL